MKILVGYNGSKLSQRALTVAQKRAKALEAQLLVFTSASAHNGASSDPKNTNLETGLKDAEMMCNACGLDCEIQWSESKLSPAEDLIQYAQKHAVDEIVIGLSQRSQLGKLLFGSISRQILLEAPCPVLTVK